MQKLKGLNTQKYKTLFKQATKNISLTMKIKRYFNGIDLKPEEFISIGKDFKNEMKNNNINRAVEILGKYNEKCLNKIFDYNNPLMNINLNLNFQWNNSQKNKKDTESKDNTDNNDEQNKKNSNNFMLYNNSKAYQKIFTPEEIEIIKEISPEREKLVEVLKSSSLSLDSVILRNNYAFTINHKGLRKESKIIYILLSLLILWLNFDAKGTIKCKKIFLV